MSIKNTNHHKYTPYVPKYKMFMKKHTLRKIIFLSRKISLKL